MKAVRAIKLVNFPTGTAKAAVVVSLLLVSGLVYFGDMLDPNSKPIASNPTYPVSNVLVIGSSNYWVSEFINTKTTLLELNKTSSTVPIGSWNNSTISNKSWTPISSINQSPIISSTPTYTTSPQSDQNYLINTTEQRTYYINSFSATRQTIESHQLFSTTKSYVDRPYLMSDKYITSKYNNTKFYKFTLTKFGQQELLILINEDVYHFNTVSDSGWVRHTVNYKNVFFNETFYHYILPVNTQSLNKISMKNAIYLDVPQNLTITQFQEYDSIHLLLMYERRVLNYRNQRYEFPNETYYVVSSALYNKIRNSDLVNDTMKQHSFSSNLNISKIIRLKEVIQGESQKGLYQQSFISLINTNVKLIDSKGMIHITGEGRTFNLKARNGSTLNTPDYVLIDPQNGTTWYWQLFPVYDYNIKRSLEYLKIIERQGSFVLVFIGPDINGFYKNLSYWQGSIWYNYTKFNNFRGNLMFQLSIFNPTKSHRNNFASFANTTTSFPHLVDSTSLLNNNYISSNDFYLVYFEYSVRYVGADFILTVFTTSFIINNTYLLSIPNFYSQNGRSLVSFGVKGNFLTKNVSLLGFRSWTQLDGLSLPPKNQDLRGLSVNRIVTLSQSPNTKSILFTGDYFSIRGAVNSGIYVRTVEGF